ncbi:Non-structural polyprotein, partial [Clarias magur]
GHETTMDHVWVFRSINRTGTASSVPHTLPCACPPDQRVWRLDTLPHLSKGPVLASRLNPLWCQEGFWDRGGPQFKWTTYINFIKLMLSY